MKLSSKKNEFGTAALYRRLSHDDNMDTGSNSIQNQKKILQKAAKEKRQIANRKIWKRKITHRRYKIGYWGNLQKSVRLKLSTHPKKRKTTPPLEPLE